jgi:hypothetical protein
VMSDQPVGHTGAFGDRGGGGLVVGWSSTGPRRLSLGSGRDWRSRWSTTGERPHVTGRAPGQLDSSPGGPVPTNTILMRGDTLAATINSDTASRAQRLIAATGVPPTP